MSSYQRRFPVVYFIKWALRRPRTANKQLEVCAFFLCAYARDWVSRADKALEFCCN